MVRALASHQCDLGSITRLGVICGLSLLLVLVLAPRSSSPGAPVFPSLQKSTFPNSNSIWIIVKHVIMSLWFERLLKHYPSLILILNKLLYFTLIYCIDVLFKTQEGDKETFSRDGASNGYNIIHFLSAFSMFTITSCSLGSNRNSVQFKMVERQ